MSRRLLLVLSCGACTVGQQPARFEAGVNVRQLSTTPGSQLAFRTTATEAAPPSAPSQAVTAALRFLVAAPAHLYFGGEAEAGTLEQAGTNLAAAYAIVGARAISRLGAIGVELAGGRRAVRYELQDPDVATAVIEPRARAELWIDPQITLGAAVGATLGEQGVWVTGVYVGIHSGAFR